MLEPKTKLWLKERFKEYYKKADMRLPEEVEKREFGFGSFTKKIVVRHRAFPNGQSLRSYLERETPAHVNHSIAYYRYPDADIDEKEWLGGDLIFDIDIGDLNIGCYKKHGDILCPECFDALKNEVLKLHELLQRDFGFSPSELKTNFSGSRGYHVRISNKDVRQLDAGARQQIVNYLACDITSDPRKGTGIVWELDGRIYGPKPTDPGLKGRIARTVIAEVKRDAGLADRDNISKEIDNGNWGAFPKGYGIKRITQYAKNVAVRIPLDAKVTTDLTHLIRMADTIHGGSGLLAKSVKSLDSFDPMSDSAVFGGEGIKVEIVADVPGFTALGKRFGAMKTGALELPKSAAVYLMCKGRARLP